MGHALCAQEPRFFTPDDYKRTGGYPTLSERHLEFVADRRDREEEAAENARLQQEENEEHFNGDFASSYAPLPKQLEKSVEASRSPSNKKIKQWGSQRQPKRRPQSPRVAKTISTRPFKLRESPDRAPSPSSRATRGLVQSPHRVPSWIDRAKAFEHGFPVGDDESSSDDEGWERKPIRRNRPQTRRRGKGGYKSGKLKATQRKIEQTQRQATMHIKKLQNLMAQLVDVSLWACNRCAS